MNDNDESREISIRCSKDAPTCMFPREKCSLRKQTKGIDGLEIQNRINCSDNERQLSSLQLYFKVNARIYWMKDSAPAQYNLPSIVYLL